mgnify:CR=1 FL=1
MPYYGGQTANYSPTTPTELKMQPKAATPKELGLQPEAAKPKELKAATPTEVKAATPKETAQPAMAREDFVLVDADGAKEPELSKWQRRTMLVLDRSGG